MLTSEQKLKLCGLALGIFSCFTVFGILQEKIFRGRFGESIDPVDGKLGERFRLPIAFGLMQDIFYTIIAKGEWSDDIRNQKVKSANIYLKFYFFLLRCRNDNCNKSTQK